MTEVQNEINKAFRLISSIAVSEDNVEKMAAAKECLRKAYKLLGEG